MPNVVFIRTKYIKGNPYAYLVENEWKKKGSRQKVNEYLGRIIEREERPEPTIAADAPADAIIPSLLRQELEGLDVAVDLKNAACTRNGRSVVVAMNGGYLCDHTLELLKKAKLARNEERPGLALAEAFSRAGIRIPQHAFITLYRSYQR